MSTQSSSPSASELVVAHTLPAKAQRRRSNATAADHILNWSPGRATAIRLPSSSAVKVSITGPYCKDDSFPTMTYVGDDPQVTVSDMDPADEAAKSQDSPIGNITITVLKGDDIDPKGARLTFLCPIHEDEITVPVETLPEPLPLSQPVSISKRSVLPALCDGPATPVEPVLTRARAPPLRLYNWEPEEADVSIHRDSEISSMADYERDGKVDASFTVEEEVKDVSIRRDSVDSNLGYDADYERDNEADALLPPPHRLQRRRLSRRVPSHRPGDDSSSDSEDYMERPSSSDEDAVRPHYEESVPSPSRLPMVPVTPSLVVQLVQIGFETVMQWMRGTKRQRSESPERDAEPLVDEVIHVAKKPKLTAVYAH